MNVEDIFEFLNEKFPCDTACDFDNVGLLLGDYKQNIKNVLITLDCTLDTVLQAIKNNCQLIITHHPVIFTPLKKIVSGSIPYELIKNNISVICMHTNLDIALGGVNTALCNTLELNDIKPVFTDDNYILQGGVIPPTNADDFATFIKQKLKSCIKYVDSNKKIETVLVCSGSGGDFLETAKKYNYDAFVTSDIKHHIFLDAYDSKISLFDAGHFNTEDVIIEPLKTLLQENFTDINFVTSHTTNIKYI